ncbi:DNA methyltransferase [Paenibacillus sp. B-A-8]|uniref:DNA methyltransferase n=1 Tax=Paenibacillus sp. B-A-8 TaxID=3400419 RepID=UPI003B027F43
MSGQQNEINVVLCGDSTEVLRGYPDAFFDSVVCDPPYGLSKEPDIAEVLTKWLAGEPYDHGHGGFMGKAWDSFVPHPDLWREVFRVLKPGGHALVFAGTRTQDLMTIALRLGGFEIRDVIEWLYFSGFPKSTDVSKQFDKRKGGASFVGEFSALIKRIRVEKGITVGFMDREVCGGSTNYSWFEGRPKGTRLPQLSEYIKIKELLGLDDTYDEMMEEAEREVVGKAKWATLKEAPMPGADCSADNRIVRDITAPTTELARKWDGWGTALKPAHEPIIVARKPLAGTVVANVEAHGTGAINIDACRIGRSEGDRTEYGVTGDEGNPTVNTFGQRERVAYIPDDAGRFPANAITTDADAFYSPYFNVSPAELSKKASKRDRNTCADGSVLTGINVHPTVKPIDLMRWLITLVTPPGGITLDPFAGSGTTLVAAAQDGFNYVGIEQAPEHVAIINARLNVSAETEAA